MHEFLEGNLQKINSTKVCSARYFWQWQVIYLQEISDSTVSSSSCVGKTSHTSSKDTVVQDEKQGQHPDKERDKVELYRILFSYDYLFYSLC